MLKYLNYILIITLLGATFSCVPTRRFDEEVTARSAAERESRESKQMATESEEQRLLAEAEIQKIEKELQELDKDYTLVKTRYDQQQKLNKDLQILYDKLLEVNEKLTQDATGRRIELTEEVTRKETELRRKEEEIRRREGEMNEMKRKMEREREEIEKLQKALADKNSNISNLEGDKSELEKNLKQRELKLKDLENQLKAREDKVKDLESSLAAREARVKELEAAITARDEKAKALKDKLNAALLGFESSDLSVEERNGKVYVSLSQNLLFSTGSSKLDSKGAEAIGKLADVLNKNLEIDVLVEGHTDSDGEAKMNWELSSKRSLSIVDQMIKNKVTPNRITAAGRGEHVPVASNDTSEGKAKNRRSDIILSPKLDAIMAILKN
jgi:chemotaxis protein MotB